jgi:RNA polymerase sigma-70 factor, ECF subfamily
MHISNDSDVIQHVRKGDRATIGAFFELYHDGIFRYLYYRVGDTHTAEDLTAEVFLRLIRSLAQHRLDDLQPKAWLYKIARNLAIDHYRKRQTYQAVTLEENVASEEVIDDRLEHSLDSHALYKAVNSLPFEQREVIILRFINNLPIAEAALTMSCSQDSIKGLQRRALISLRQFLLDRGMVDLET